MWDWLLSVWVGTPEWVKIVVALGGLEIALWIRGQKEAAKQTDLLEDIAVSLSLREIEKQIESTDHD
jgi:hypothetical protein